MKKATIEMAKELARLILFASLAVIINFVTQKLGVADQNNVFVILGTIGIKLVDKWIHENKDIKLNGVAPF